jgi:hypothetical protein
MGGGDDARFPIGEEDRRAVGGEDAEDQPGAVGHHRIGFGASIVGKGRDHVYRLGRVDLMERDQLRFGRHGGDRPAAILADRLPIVAGAQADIEAFATALGDSPAPPQEAMRDSVQRAGGKDVYRSSFHISSSSAWSPTMNL